MTGEALMRRVTTVLGVLEARVASAQQLATTALGNSASFRARIASLEQQMVTRCFMSYLPPMEHRLTPRETPCRVTQRTMDAASSKTAAEANEQLMGSMCLIDARFEQLEIRIAEL